MPLLEVRGLSVEFPARGGALRAVDGIDLDVEPGEVVALVGESGSGKSTVALACMDLLGGTGARVSCERLAFGGRDLLALPPRERARLRGRAMSQVFQDPLTSLSPYLTIGAQLCEVLDAHRIAAGDEARARAAAALGEMGLPEPEAQLDLYPHELSGGMRQRALIAMALLAGPALVFADEPTTALDATVQAQILELLRERVRGRGTALVLITHALGVVAGLADRVEVMYAGRIVEGASARDVFRRPLHPYTRALLASAPRLDQPVRARLAAIDGSPADLAALPAGCAFAPRCALAESRCARERPRLESVAIRLDDERPRRSACFEWPRLAASGAATGAAGDAADVARR